MIIDFHTHCFPDEIAVYAVPKLAGMAPEGIRAFLDGRLTSLLASMEKAGIAVCVVQHIATKPKQEKTINTWAAKIQTELGPGKIYSFRTIHPETPDWRGEIKRLLDLGLKGVKFHPDYQNFFVDEKRLFPLYEELCREKLPVLFHSGVDIGLPEPCHCEPARLRKVIETFPEGKWIAAHMGGWQRWDEVERYLLGLRIYMDTSYCLPHIGKERMVRLIREHGAGRILFGSDSPWADQREAVEEIVGLALSPEEKEQILGKNAAVLLELRSSKGCFPI
ncbi:MAG: amidohydrolase family protein [Firmicutes bacterium]|nr:amidohydrolase family protein [Bacillota bacterium]